MPLPLECLIAVGVTPVYAFAHGARPGAVRLHRLLEFWNLANLPYSGAPGGQTRPTTTLVAIGKPFKKVYRSLVHEC